MAFCPTRLNTCLGGLDPRAIHSMELIQCGFFWNTIFQCTSLIVQGNENPIHDSLLRTREHASSSMKYVMILVPVLEIRPDSSSYYPKLELTINLQLNFDQPLVLLFTTSNTCLSISNQGSRLIFTKWKQNWWFLFAKVEIYPTLGRTSILKFKSALCFWEVTVPYS